MQLSIKYLPGTSDMIPGNLVITCEDDEAQAVMQSINQELKWMEAKRIHAYKDGSKMSKTEMPHFSMHAEADCYSFNSSHISDVCLAARQLVGQEKQNITITTAMIDKLEQELYKYNA